jgi:hypothetical protein
MSAGGRARARGRLLQRFGLVAAIAAILALLFLVSGHWILFVIAAVVTAVFGWLFLQARAVR